MKYFKIGRAVVLFLKCALVVFTILYCCFFLQPDASVKKGNLRQYEGLKVTDQAQSFIRPNTYILPKLSTPGFDIAPLVLDLVTTISYRSKAAFSSGYACRVFYAITTINAP